MRSTKELERIDELIELNLSLSKSEIMQIIKDEGLTISPHRLRYKKNYMLKGTAGKPKPIRPEPVFFDELKWQDTSPDRVQDYEIFDLMINKYKQQKLTI